MNAVSTEIMGNEESREAKAEADPRKQSQQNGSENHGQVAASGESSPALPETKPSDPASAPAVSLSNNVGQAKEEPLPPAALDLANVESLAPVGAESVGQHNVKPEDLLHVGGADQKEGSASRPADLDFFGRPRPKNLVRKWPSMLMYLMSQASDDEWREVMDRVQSHPAEIAIQGVNGGQNALHACCVRYPPLHVVRAILDADSSVVLQRNFNGETPLHIASYSSSEEVQSLLVQRVPEAATLMDQYGDSPLHFAARAGATYNLMESFVAAAPSMISQPNERGVTPLWLLPRSYLETDDLEEVMDTEGEDYRDDWDSLALFLRYSYKAQGTKSAQVRDEDGTPVQLRREDYTWIVHAAAATPACPREVLKWLCRMFPEQALRGDEHGFTPLLLAVQQKEMKEPRRWNQLEDGFRETVEVADGELQNENEQLREEEAALGAGDAAFLEHVFHGETDDASRAASSLGSETPVCKESVVEILLEWSPRSALQADSEGRLPLTYALLSGLSWKQSVSPLIAACPRALECRDFKTGLYNFQLAAINSPQLDTVYSLVRSLPELLAREQCEYRIPPSNTKTDDEPSSNNEPSSNSSPNKRLSEVESPDPTSPTKKQKL